MPRMLTRLLAGLLLAVTIALPETGTAVHLPAANGIERGVFVADFTRHDGSAGGVLRRLDPATLADLPDSPPRDVPVTPGGNFIYREWLSSADGTNAVTIDWPRESPLHRAVVVRRGISGQIVSEFEIPGQLGQAIPLGQRGATFLSANGDLIVAATESLQGFGVTWYVYRTADGQQVATFEDASARSTDEMAMIVAMSAIDFRAARHFRLVPPAASGSRGLRLIATDLQTGTELGVIDLPDLAWSRESLPAIAVSLDRTEVVVLDPARQSVTAVTIASLTVDRTIALASPLLDAGATTPVATKPGGQHWSMTFAADETLLIAGMAFSLTAAGPRVDGALARVDPATGDILARTPLTAYTLVWPSADGQSLYLTHFAADDPVTPGMTVRRLDPASLSVLAERTIPGRVYLVTTPRVASSHLVTQWF